MRVLHVIDKSFIGGGQNAAASLLRSFRDTDITCSLACRDGGPLVQTAEAMGVRVHRVPFDKRFRPGPAWRIASIVKRERIDVIHCHGLVATTYAAMARGLFVVRAPILYHQHGFHHHNYGGHSRPLRVAAERAICRRVDRVLAGSQADFDALAGHGYGPPDHVRLVHYGIPDPASSPDALARATAEAGVQPDDVVIGAVARLHPQKSVDVLLRAAARLRPRIPRLKLLIVGTGELEQELHALAHTLGLDGCVVWLGGQPNLPFLPLFSVGVIASSWEGFPLTILEYMAMRTPIVTTSIPGCMEAIGADGGLAVPPRDPAAMADAIMTLLHDRTRAKAVADVAHARFQEHFTLAAMSGRVRRVYDEVVS